MKDNVLEPRDNRDEVNVLTLRFVKYFTSTNAFMERDHSVGLVSHKSDQKMAQ